MSDIEAKVSDIFSNSKDYIDLRVLREILAPGDTRGVAKLIETKKLRDMRAQIESNGVVAARSSSDGKFEVHVDLALEYAMSKNKGLMPFVTRMRDKRLIIEEIRQYPGLSERVRIVFGTTGRFVFLPEQHRFFLQEY